MKVIDLLKPEFFYKEKNKIIFKYIIKLFYEYKKINLLNLVYTLKKDNKLNIIGGEHYLSYLMQKFTSLYNIKIYIKKIIDKFILRKIIKLSINLINKSYENIDIINILDYIQIKIFDITNKYINNNIKSIKYLINKTFKKIKNNYFKKKLFIIPTYFKKLDEIILGLQKSDLIIIASRPGMGKTSFALSLINNIIKKNKNIAIGLFSLEMSYIQIITRLITFNTNISYDKLKTSNLTKLEYNILNKNIKKLKKYPLFIDDSSSLSIIEFKNKCQKLIYNYKVKLIIIDYLQLINIKNSKFKFTNREQEISIISRNIKYIAKEFKIPIIAISQLSRAVELRGGNKRPLLTDLRESGSIEQDADIVLLLYRPEYYGFKYWDNVNLLCSGEAEIIIAKHRNGRLGNIKLKFINKIAMFKN